MNPKRAALCVATMLLAGAAHAAIDWNEPRTLVDVAVANSPTIARLDAEVRAAQERVRPASAQPNPMVMAGVENKQVDLTDDEMMTMYVVGASQTFTRPDKRAARRDLAELAVRGAELQLASARAELEREVLFAWYDLAAVQSQSMATMQVRELVDALVDAARVRYEVGSAGQAEVIRAQLARSDLDRQLMRLRGARAAAIARLLPLLDLPLDTDVPRFGLPESTKTLGIPGPAAPPENHPALAALRTEVERQQQAIAIARLDGKPDFGVQAEYGYRRTQTSMFSASVTVELPVRKNSTIEPRVREAIALRDAAERRIEELRRTLVRDLAVAKASHDEMSEQIRFHDEVLVPQARLAIDSTLAAYQTGGAAFDAVLATETTYLRLQLDYFDYLARHVKAVTDFEAILRGARGGASASGGAMTITPAATAATSMSSPSSM
jgi:outer membrane protein, heavy metal efflux system